MRKPAFCLCENKGADQLRGNRKVDQRLCFRYIDSTITVLSKSEIACLLSSSVALQPGLCPTWSKTPKTIFFHNEAHIKPQSHIHGFGPGRATVHPDLSNRGASA